MAGLDAAILRCMKSDPDHSVIDNKMHRGIIFLKAAPIQQVGKVLKGCEGVAIPLSMKYCFILFLLWLH